MLTLQAIAVRIVERVQQAQTASALPPLPITGSFTNSGRFAAAHAAGYGEPPAAMLRTAPDGLVP